MGHLTIDTDLVGGTQLALKQAACEQRNTENTRVSRLKLAGFYIDAHIHGVFLS